jgi:hypothetical protein
MPDFMIEIEAWAVYADHPPFTVAISTIRRVYRGECPKFADITEKRGYAEAWP